MRNASDTQALYTENRTDLEKCPGKGEDQNGTVMVRGVGLAAMKSAVVEDEGIPSLEAGGQRCPEFLLHLCLCVWCGWCRCRCR